MKRAGNIFGNIKEKVQRLFGGLNMTWPAVLIYAAATGIYTGLIMLVPFLDETSFQDIGVSYEFWVVFAVILVVNCKKSPEAGLKCFVFFLLSQPLVYLVEIIAGTITLRMAINYYRFWFFLTLLCLPGGFIAFYAKKENLFGSIVLGIGNSIQMFMGLVYCVEMSRSFPFHFLSIVFSFASIAVMTLCLQKKTKYRIISALAVPAAAAVIGFTYLGLTGLSLV